MQRILGFDECFLPRWWPLLVLSILLEAIRWMRQRERERAPANGRVPDFGLVDFLLETP